MSRSVLMGTRTTPFYGQLRRKGTLFSKSADDFDNEAHCTVVGKLWKQCNYVGAKKPHVSIVESISSGQVLNFDIITVISEFHTISAIRKTT